MSGNIQKGEEEKALKPTKKKVGRKRVPQKKHVKQPKVRGKYQPIYAEPISGIDRDLAGCIFSDDEVSEEFLNQVGDGDESSDGQVEMSTTSSVTELSLDASEASSSVASSSIYGSESSAQESRPTSASSRPESSLVSSRPASVLSLDADPLYQDEVKTVDSTIAEPDSVSVQLFECTLLRLKSLLPIPWIVIADQTGFHFLLMCSKFPKAIQREIFVSLGGNVLVSIHCVLVPSFKKLFGLDSCSPVVLNDASVDMYCDYCINLLKFYLRFDVCVGANDMETRGVWGEMKGCYIDTNPYKEESYEETCRSESCLRLVELGKGKRCKKCAALMKNISLRKSFHLSPVADPNTSNEKLTKQQAYSKLDFKQDRIRKKDKQIAYLKRRYQMVLEAEGCNIDDDLNDFFSTVLTASELSKNQKMFLQEQWACSNKSDARAHRWHPSMIRFALHLHMVSTAGYEALRESGLIKLPCARTLYDYSHSIHSKDGVNEGLVEFAANDVKKFGPENRHQQYHVLICDGMHVSQNLVFKKSDGSLVGVTYFDNIDKEMQRLENYVEGKEPIVNDPQLASEVLAYMVKGLASHVKCLIAAFPCKILTKEMLYKRSWEVINMCEKAGIKILAFICDGHPVNRAFIEMHTPWTQKDSGIIFDTLNFCAEDERPLFFISDVCHLLKTIRNCFYNSGEGEKKTRLMQVNGEKIVWKTIVRLYLSYKNDNFRKAYKLNPQNVFPNPYARMRVRYAAHVLSNTVAEDLEKQNWPATKETVNFIRLCNRFFDVLNGAHSSQKGRSLKNDLAAYTHVDDPRFVWLEETFLKYLKDWKKQVNCLPITAEEKEKMMLSHQTLTGIEMTIYAFIAATKFFLDPEKINGKFLMARVFSQDPLEQEFSKHRAGGGGSRTPNMAQFESKMVSLAIQRDLGIKRRRGNVTAEGDIDVTISEEPLPKRSRSDKKKN